MTSNPTRLFNDLYDSPLSQGEVFTSLALDPGSVHLPEFVEVNEETLTRGGAVPISSLDEVALVELDKAIVEAVVEFAEAVRQARLAIRKRSLELAPPIDLFSVAA